MVILIAIIIACLLYLGRGVIGSLVNHDPVDPAPSSSMNSDNAPEDPDQPDQSDLTDPNAGTEPTVEDNPDDTQDDDTNAPDDTTQPEDDTTAAGPLTRRRELYAVCPQRQRYGYIYQQGSIHCLRQRLRRGYGFEKGYHRNHRAARQRACGLHRACQERWKERCVFVGRRCLRQAQQ